MLNLLRIKKINIWYFILKLIFEKLIFDIFKKLIQFNKIGISNFEVTLPCYVSIFFIEIMFSIPKTFYGIKLDGVFFSTQRPTCHIVESFISVHDTYRGYNKKKKAKYPRLLNTDC